MIILWHCTFKFLHGGEGENRFYKCDGVEDVSQSALHHPCLHHLHHEKQLFKGRHLERDGKEVSGIICTANEGPVRVQYKCLVPIYVFPEMKLFFPKQNSNVMSPSSYTQISVRDYIFPGSVCLFCCRKICGPILEYIYKSLTDTWMWKLVLRPHNSQKRNS